MPLVKFDNPPLTEVVFEVDFQEPAAMSAAHFGLIWLRFRDRFPTTEDRAPIITTDRFPPDPWMSPRVWFVHSDDSRVIQVQKDRFIFNWRRRNDEYPSFDVVYPEFQDYFAEFRSALKELQLPRIMPNRLELKYINIIDENITLDSYGDLTQIFPDFCWRNDEMRFLPSPRNLHLNYHFDLPDNFGSILFSLKSGTVKQTDRRVLQLEITAQGMSPDTDAETLGTWFNLAHEWIVCAFEDMTSQEIQTTVWRRR